MQEPEKPKVPFQGVGRTLGGTSSSSTSEQSQPTTDPAPSNPSAPAVIDPSLPSTSIQLRLADGTRLVGHFNLHHTINDIRTFIDLSRPGTSRNYQLQTGFPPKLLTDSTQTIEQSGLASSVIMQKL